MVTAARVACDEDGRIATDLLCAACGHNLRSLKPGGVCTECGSPVKWSLGDGTLRFADPRWVSAVRSGLGWVVLMLPWLWLPLTWPLFFWGLWRLTARAPQDPQEWPPFWLLAVRMGPPVVLVAALASVTIVEAVRPWCNPQFARSATVLAWVAVAVLVSVAVDRLGRRSDSRRLRRLSSASVLLNGIAFALLVLGAANALLELDFLLLIAAALLGGLAAVAGVISLAIVLLAAWGELESAEVHARAVRQELRPWLRPEPGSAFLAQALRTRGGSYSGADPGVTSGQ